MNTFNTIMDFVIHLIFNWTTYAWSMLIWILIFIVILKYLNNKVTVGDFIKIIIVSLFNPILNWFLVIFIVLIPLIMVTSYVSQKFDKIKNKKLF